MGSETDGSTITSFPQGKAFVSGEGLKVNTLHENRGDHPWEVPTPDEPSPLRYEVRAEGGERSYHVSHDDFVTLLRNEPPERTVPPELHAIAPGSKLIRSEDVAALSREPFAPGRYLLISRLRRGDALLASPPAPLEIVAPRLEAAASAFCAVRGSLAGALAHRLTGGGTLILARESYRGWPSLGVFRRVEELAGEAPVRDLRVFVDTAEIVAGRFIAWVREGRAHARKVWGAAVEQALDGIGPDWEAIRLVGPGFHLADASGLLLVTGQEGSHHRVALVHLGPAGAEILREAELPEAPEALAATHGVQGPELLWGAPGVVRALGLGRASSARTVAHLDGSLAAWSIPAVTRVGPTRLALLEGPAGGALRLHTGFLDGTELASRLLGPVPDDVSRWGLLHSADGAETWILAASAGRLLSARADDALAFREVGRLAPADPWFQCYFSAPGAAWAEWDEPFSGLRRAPLIP